MTNKIDDGSAGLTFPDFCLLIGEKAKELDPRLISRIPSGSLAKMKTVKYIRLVMLQEIFLSGCIPADEMKFVVMHLPGGVT
jgi:hypothetical protein